MKNKSVSGTVQVRFGKAHPERMRSIVFFLLMILSVLPGYNGATLAQEGEVRPVAASPNLCGLQARLTLNLMFTGPDGNVLAAGERGFLTLTFVNENDSPVENVVIDIGEGEKDGVFPGDLSYDKRLVLGLVEPHQTVTREIPLSASGGALSREVMLTARIPGCEGGASPEQSVRIRLKPVDLPRLAVSVVEVRDQDGSSRIEAGKIVRLSVRIQNIGTGDASQVSAHVRTWRDVFVAGDGNTYFELGNIGADKFVDFAFLVYTGVRTTWGRNIPVTVYVNEARSRFDVVAPLELPFGSRPACNDEAEGSKVK